MHGVFMVYSWPFHGLLMLFVMLVCLARAAYERYLLIVITKLGLTLTLTLTLALILTLTLTLTLRSPCGTFCLRLSSSDLRLIALRTLAFSNIFDVARSILSTRDKMSFRSRVGVGVRVGTKVGPRVRVNPDGSRPTRQGRLLF